MAIEIPHSVRLFAIPRWLKVAYCFILLIFILLSIFLLFDIELINSRIHPVKISDKFSGAFGQILAVLIPIILISALVVFSISSEDSIKQKANDFFLNKLPRQLEKIPDGSFPTTGRWVSVEDRKLRKILSENTRKEGLRSSILVDKYVDDFCCNYLISFPCYKSRLVSVVNNLDAARTHGLESVLPIRLEVNVRKVNLGIFFRKSLLLKYLIFNFGEEALFDKAVLVNNGLEDIEERMRRLLSETMFDKAAVLVDSDRLNDLMRKVEEGFDSSVWVKLIRCFFEHSMGAQSLGEQSKSDHEINGEIRYRINLKAMEVSIDVSTTASEAGGALFQGGKPSAKGAEYVGVVYSAIMKPDFLWENSEVLFFCQDLLLMLRSFVNEQPDLFLSEAAEASVRQISAALPSASMYEFSSKDSTFLLET